MPLPPSPFFPATSPTKTKNQYADKALMGTTDGETDLLPGDRPNKVRLKPPIQGNDASQVPVGYDNPPTVDKGGKAINPTDQKPPLAGSPPTVPNQAAPTSVPQTTMPGNNIVIRQWNNNRGIPNARMQWDPATQALMMDGRPVFQVGRNMSIDAQGNGVTDYNTWQQEMQRYGYGEQSHTNIPDYERKLLAGADATRDPAVYWPSAEGQAARQQISRDRDKGLIDARAAAGARGASTDSGTYARFMGNVYGTEQQALVDAAPKLMDATRRSYLDVLNSDIMARNQANAQEIAESNATGMFRGQMAYPTQKDYIQGVLDVAKNRETMPGMNTGILTHPGLQAIGGQVNDIAGRERYDVTHDKTAAAVQREGNLLTDARALAASKGWTSPQQNLYNLAHAWAMANGKPMTAATLEEAKRQFGSAGGMNGKQSEDVLETLFGGGKAASEPSRADVLDAKVATLTGLVLGKLPDQKLGVKLALNPQVQDKIWTDVQQAIRELYSTPEGRQKMLPLSLAAAETMAKDILEISKTTTDGLAIQQQIIGHQGGAGN